MSHKKQSILKNAIIILALCMIPLVCVNGFAFLAYNGQALNRKNFSNWTALHLGEYINTNAELLGIPEQGETFVSGRSDRYANFAVTAFTSDGRTEYLLGNETIRLTAWWTARVQDGTAQEIWYSHHELSADELHPYSNEMQKKSMHFVLFPLPHSWIDDRALVGYWKYNEPDKTDKT